jgi:hypothetical protein
MSLTTNVNIRPQMKNMAEDAIMDILQPHQSGITGLKACNPDDESSDEEKPGCMDRTTTVCARCRDKYPMDAHICPFCHKYVNQLQWW